MIRKRTGKKGTSYAVRVYRPATGGYEWVGTFPTKREAKVAEREAQSSPSASSMTCNDYADHWLEGYRARVKATSYTTAVRALEKFKADWRGIPLAKVTRVEAEKWARENKQGRVNVVVTMFNSAVDADLIDRNPFRKLSAKGGSRRKNRPLTLEEIDALAIKAREQGDVVYALIVTLAYTGMRTGEAFALEWDDLDLPNRRGWIRRRVYNGDVDLPKSNKERPIVIPPPVRDALMRLERKGPLVFYTPATGTRFSRTSFQWHWNKIAAVVDRPVVPHEFRHFTAHYLYVKLGLPDHVVAVGSPGTELEFAL